MDSESHERPSGRQGRKGRQGRQGRQDRNQANSGDEPASSDSRGDAGNTTADAMADASTDETRAEGGEQSGPLPDLVRKALAMGLTGFFTTEQTIRYYPTVGAEIEDEVFEFEPPES